MRHLLYRHIGWWLRDILVHDAKHIDREAYRAHIAGPIGEQIRNRGIATAE